MRVGIRILATLVVALAILFVAVHAAPAQLAGWWLRHASGGALLITDAQGSLYDGRGNLGDAAGRWSVPVAWTLETGALARGVLGVRFGASPADAVRGTLRVSPARVDASDVDVTLPAAIMTGSLPPMIALNAGGSVVLTATAFTLDDHAHGHASVHWAPARVADAAAQTVDFGSVTADIVANGERIDVTINSAGGDTALAGTARVAGARVDADVTLTPRRQPPSSLLRTLAAFGAAAADGGTRFGYHGEWAHAAR